MANAQDVASFLSTRLVVVAITASPSSSSSLSSSGERDDGEGSNNGKRNDDDNDGGDYDSDEGREPEARLRRYERRAAELASEFEGGMIRF